MTWGARREKCRITWALKILEKNDGESIAVKNKFHLPMIAWIKCAISQKCGVKIIALNDEESVAIKNF